MKLQWPVETPRVLSLENALQGSVEKWHLSNASLNLFVISEWLDSDAGWLEQAAPDLKPCLNVLLQAFVRITGARRVSHAFVPQFTPSKQRGQISHALIDTFSLAVVTFSTVATEKTNSAIRA